MYELHWKEVEFYAQDGEWNTWNHCQKFDNFNSMKSKFEELKLNKDNKSIRMTEVLEEFSQE